MSRFFVGQRVRIVRHWRRELNFIELVQWRQIRNAEARVSELAVHNQFGEVGIAVMVGPMECVLPDYGLEPILYDGDRAGLHSLSELLDRCSRGEGVPA